MCVGGTYKGTKKEETEKAVGSYLWYSNSRSYRETISPSWMPISSSLSNRPDWRSFWSNQLRDSKSPKLTLAMSYWSQRASTTQVSSNFSMDTLPLVSTSGGRST